MNEDTTNPETPQTNPEWEGKIGDSMAEVQKAASNATDGEVANIAGQENVDLQMAAEKINEALKYVHKFFGDDLDIDLTKIRFKQFGGNIVGESVHKGILVDPEMLMHPAVRLAHLLAHELLHKGDKVPSERLVQAYCSIHFGKEHLTGEYSEHVDNFREFAAEYGGDADLVNGAIVDIYNLYAAGKYEDILDQYLDKFDRKDRDDAIVRFFDVFPELEMSTSGGVTPQPVAVAEELLKDEA